MPVDKYGVVADIVMDGGSIINRLNPGRLYEITINNIFENLRREIVQAISTDNSAASYEHQFNRILRAYTIISPKFAEYVKQRPAKKHIDSIIKGAVKVKRKVNGVDKMVGEGVVIWLPTDNPVRLDHAIDDLNKEFPATSDHILLTRPDGTKVWSKDKGIIGKQYIIILEKTGEEYSAVSTPVLQHQGIPGKLSKADKQCSPGRPQATRFTGETEGRLMNALAHFDALFRLLDIANSPTTQRAVTRELLTHPTPTKIDRIIDRTVVPRNNNRIVNIVKNSMLVAGFQFEHRPIGDD